MKIQDTFTSHPGEETPLKKKQSTKCEQVFVRLFTESTRWQCVLVHKDLLTIFGLGYGGQVVPSQYVISSQSKMLQTFIAFKKTSLFSLELFMAFSSRIFPACCQLLCTHPGLPLETPGCRFASSGWRAAPGRIVPQTERPRCSPSWRSSRSTWSPPSGCSSRPVPCSAAASRRGPPRPRGPLACVASLQRETSVRRVELGMQTAPASPPSRHRPQLAARCSCPMVGTRERECPWDRPCCPRRRRCSRGWLCQSATGSAPPARLRSVGWWRRKWGWPRTRLCSTWTPARETVRDLRMQDGDRSAAGSQTSG